MTQTVGRATRVPGGLRPPLRLADLTWHLPVAALLAAGVVQAAVAGSPGPRLASLATGLLAYLALRRWAVWGWLAALATAPAALGLGLLHPVHGVDQLGSVLVSGLVAAGLVASLWRARPPLVVLAPATVATVVGLLARWAVGADAPARVSWGAAAPFFVLALPAALGALAAVGLARADAVTSLRAACGAVVLAPLVALVATGGDGRALLTWWPAAGALGLTALLRGRRGVAASRPQVDRVDRDAEADFDRRYRRPRLAPVAIVIAAYNEAEGLPGVLAGLPADICGLPADVLVVDDGSTDGTAEAVSAAIALSTTRAGRSYLVAATTNRGQGAALRLGYRVARDHGSAYVVTTDADGQYDVADLPGVLQPLLDGRADFVTGSRRLGALHNRDRVRQLGTHVFAWLASVLLGRRLTDTSFGLRAMRVEVTAAVTLNQPQYQSSELLLGAASHGFTVLEVPGTMHRRSAGSSKKGGNLVYGSRYARVVLGTWWREGAPRPVPDVAPAMQVVGDDRRVDR